MKKISETFIISIVFIFALGFLFIFSGYTIINSWQTSQNINEQIVQQKNPVLNKNKVDQAVTTINSFENSGIEKEKIKQLINEVENNEEQNEQNNKENETEQEEEENKQATESAINENTQGGDNE